MSSGLTVMIPNTEPANDGDNDNNTNLTLDFGAWKPASLGNFVWEDLNHDGVQDANEPGIAGVQVSLYLNGVAISTTTTDANGNYAFTNLLSGVPYTVSFTAPASYTFTLQNTTNITDDSDVNPLTGVSQPLILQPGENNPTIDAGLWRPMSLGNRVWEDVNNDGVDASEAGVSGVTMTLYLNGVAISTTTTDAAGYYTFTGLISGTYSVTAQLPAGYVSSTPDETDPNAGGDLNDNGLSATGGVVTSGPIVMIPDTESVNDGDTDANTNFTIDFGAWRPASLGNFVWEDLNHDGIQDANEPGIAGVVVTLQSPSGVITTVTDANGFYSFINLLSGVSYIVFFDKPANYAYTLQNTTNITNDSNVDPQSGTTPAVILAPGENNLTIDAGLWRPMSLGNRVWEDVNNDGLDNNGESGIAGVTMTLYLNGVAISTMTTDANGSYIFTGLISGTYSVTAQLPAGYVSSTPDESDPNNNGDLNDNGVGSSGGIVSSGPIVMIPGTESVNDGDADANTNFTIDFGAWQPASLGDRVWNDANADGIQDPNESGVVGVTVVLYDAITNSPIATTTTGANGYYSFTHLIPGSYFVEFVLPVDYGRSPQYAGGDITADSNADVNTGRSEVVTLKPNEHTPTIDAGIYQYSSLGDRVWFDANRNGQQDGGEVGVAGVTVTLYLNGAPVSTALTDGTGFYGFSMLTPTVPYTVQFTLPDGYQWTLQDSGADASDSDVDANGATGSYTLAPNEHNPTVDAGIWAPLMLGNQVWLDNNNNGAIDAGEAGVDGVTMELYLDTNGDGVFTPGVDQLVSTTVTSNGGFYLFSDLIEGNYLVVLPASNFANGGPLAGYQSSTLNDTTDGNMDNMDDGRPAAGGAVSSGVINLKIGTEPTGPLGNENLTVDFGFWQPASLGDRVWLDVDRNGQQDAGEAGVSGVTVTLYDSNGNAIATTATDASGFYQFTNLLPGTYSVGFTAPDGYSWTVREVGADAGDSDADTTTGRTGSYTLAPGEHNPTVDGGVWRAPTLTIAKVGLKQGAVAVGDVLTYSITIKNPSDTAALNVVLSDPLPAYLTYVSASSEPSVNATHDAGSHTVNWPVGTLMPGATFTGTVVTMLYSRPEGGQVKNIANVQIDGVSQPFNVDSNEVSNPLQPTAVTLARFEATVMSRGGVQVVWQTTLERDTFGFNVWRSATGNRVDAVKVNAELVVAKGGSSLTSYSVDDAAGSVNSVYWLEEIELSGAAREYGPVKASVAQPVQPGVPQPSVPQPSVPNAGVPNAGVVGGGVPGVPVLQQSSQQPAQQPAVQPAAQPPVVVPTPAPVAQPVVQQPAMESQAQPAVQPEVQPEVQPAPQPTAEAASAPAAVVESAPANAEVAPTASAVVNTAPANAEAAVPAMPAAQNNAQVVGAETGVSVARGGQAVMPQLPSATVNAETAEVQATQPVNPLLPVGAGALALLGLSIAGVFIVRRKRK